MLVLWTVRYIKQSMLLVCWMSKTIRLDPLSGTVVSTRLCCLVGSTIFSLHYLTLKHGTRKPVVLSAYLLGSRSCMSLGRCFYLSKTVSLLNLSFDQGGPGRSHKRTAPRPYRSADRGGNLRTLLADATQRGGARARCIVRLVWLWPSHLWPLNQAC